MPGTGKTTTITALIEILIKNNKKVLISSYTNTAVDNILLKLQEKNIDFFRVGNIDKVIIIIKIKIESYIYTYLYGKKKLFFIN